MASWSHSETVRTDFKCITVTGLPRIAEAFCSEACPQEDLRDSNNSNVLGSGARARLALKQFKSTFTQAEVQVSSISGKPTRSPDPASELPKTPTDQFSTSSSKALAPKKQGGGGVLSGRGAAGRKQQPTIFERYITAQNVLQLQNLIDSQTSPAISSACN